ncbi:MAG TPA: cytochrome c biogenesis protein CcsA [Ktedonobacterales bacterium]
MVLARTASEVVGPPLRRYGERVLLAAVALTMTIAIWAAFLYAPTDLGQGDIQRILYFHVPLAIVSYVAFFVTFAASILYLWRRDARWDALASASAEVGVVYATLMLVAGMLWGQGYWGRPWDWADPRLTSTFVLWLIYVGYLLLRFYAGRTEATARIAAVVGIVGFVDVPIVHFAVTWWRSIHPDTDYLLGDGGSALPPAATFALLAGFLAFTLLYVFLVVQVYRVERMQQVMAQLRARVTYGADDEGGDGETVGAASLESDHMDSIEHIVKR